MPEKQAHLVEECCYQFGSVWMYNTCRFEIFEVLVKLLRQKQEVDPKRGRNCVRARVLNATHLVVETCKFMILHFFICAMILGSGPAVCAAYDFRHPTAIHAWI